MPTCRRSSTGGDVRAAPAASAGVVSEAQYEEGVVRLAIGAWDDLAGKNQVVGFVDLYLRGASQVFFQNNPLTGLIIIGAIFWGAPAVVGLGAVIGLLVATTTAILLDVDGGSLKQGLFGFNGILVGVAVPTFLSAHPMMWAYLVIGAAVSTVVTLAITNVVKNWGVPGSTAPFVLTTWLLLLGAYALANVPVASMGPPALPTVAGAAANASPAGNALLGILAKNVSQVFLVENVATGVLFVGAIAISSVRGAVFAVVGSVVSVIVATVLGATITSINAGLYGFSAVLTAMAVGAVFNPPSVRVTLYAILATIFTVIVQAALNTALSPVGIPTLTFPYVLTMWFFLLPKADLAPLPHHQLLPDGALTKR